jgi:hypothetical protein
MFKKKVFTQDIEERKKLLTGRLGFITEELKSNEKSRYFRCRGYLREISLQYDIKQFLFKPDEFIIDKHGILSICIGVAKAPTTFDGNVLWIFSEGDSEISFI